MARHQLDIRKYAIVVAGAVLLSLAAVDDSRAQTSCSGPDCYGPQPPVINRPPVPTPPPTTVQCDENALGNYYNQSVFFYNDFMRAQSQIPQGDPALIPFYENYRQAQGMYENYARACGRL
jgi:hypothetical protein